MTSFTNLRIKWKIIGMAMLVSTTALVLATTGYLTFEWFDKKRATAHDLLSGVKIVGLNSVAPLEFNDSVFGGEVLQSLKINPDVIGAAIYKKDGGIFASYERDPNSKTAFPATPREDGIYFDEDLIFIFDSILFKGEKIGTIYLQAEMKRMQELVEEFSVIGTTVFLISFATAFLLAMKLQATISGPINKLKDATVKFGQGKMDAGFEIQSGDEVGELSAAFVKMLRELNVAQGRLLHSEKLSALGKLTASIAHEFNNPITGLRNILEQIDEDSPHMEAELKNLLALGIKECYRMADLVQKLRHFYKPAHEETFSRINIHKVLDEAILLLQKKLQERNIRLVKNYAADLPEIEAVEDQIKQVLMNLIQNAEDAITGADGRIAITTEFRDPYVRILVQDSGDGIPESILQSIFDPFFTTKPDVKGTGLGLSVSHGIIKKHKGDIEVRSQVGQGAIFTITLPVKQ